MNNLTLTQKQYLASFCKSGGKVTEVAYNPTTVGINGGTSTPEADAIAAGYTQYYKESSTYLIEVIYTK